MKSTKKIICMSAAFLIFAAGSTMALDLSRYQAYMSDSDKNRQTQQQNAQSAFPAPQIVQTPQISQTAGYTAIPADTSADAYYIQGQPGEYVSLGSTPTQRDGEHYLLPPDTRVPEELRPLLTERRTPRQGLACAGGTGGFLIPSPGVLEPNKTAIGVHIQPFDLYNNNGTKYTDEDYFDTTVSLAFGAEDGIEVGLDKKFGNQDRFDVPEPTYFNCKYQATGNVTIGGSFCSSSDGYSSMWVGAGVPAIWVGVGGNFGPGDFKYTATGWNKIKKSRYGGYNFDAQKGEGYADPVFFMVGGALPLNDHLRFVYDFNGDKFSLGFRFDYQSILFLDAAFVSDGDYENMPESVAHKKDGSFVFGGSVTW